MSPGGTNRGGFDGDSPRAAAPQLGLAFGNCLFFPSLNSACRGPALLLYCVFPKFWSLSILKLQCEKSPRSQNCQVFSNLLTDIVGH